MNIVSAKGKLRQERMLALIALSQYMPTKEKLRRIADKYEAGDGIFAFFCEDNGFPCGITILTRQTDDVFEMISLAVDPAFRGQGIASTLISTAMDTLRCRTLYAETDDDAVGFYRKYGFHIKSLGEKYPGSVRYHCTFNRL